MNLPKLWNNFAAKSAMRPRHTARLPAMMTAKMTMAG